MPVPKVVTSAKRAKSARRARPAILTDSPYKKEIMDLQQKANSAKRSLPSYTNKKICKKSRSAGKAKRTKKQCNDKKICNESGPASEAEKAKKSKKEPGDDTECMYCENLNSASAEEWIQCEECSQWSHSACTVVDDSDLHFTCDLCSEQYMD